MNLARTLLMLACTLLVSGLVLPPVAAYTISEGIVPAGEINSHAPVTVSYKIHFTGSSQAASFPVSDSLVLDTDLEDAVWTWELVIDGNENSRPLSRGKSLELSGYELSYPARVNEFIIVRLDGIAPGVQSAEPRNLMKIRQMDPDDQIVRESLYRQTIFPALRP